VTVTRKNVAGMEVMFGSGLAFCALKSAASSACNSDHHDVDVCLTDPWFEVDVSLGADLRTLTEVWLVDARFVDALTDGRITLEGPRELTRRILDWFGKHPVLADVGLG
jgi:hypothetical protein